MLVFSMFVTYACGVFLFLDACSSPPFFFPTFFSLLRCSFPRHSIPAVKRLSQIGLAIIRR